MALTEWHDLLARLEQQPESDILAAMLTDELMDARGMNRTEADRYVATARRVAQDTADIAWAANLIRAKGPAFDGLVRDVQSALGLVAGETVTLFLVAGAEPPEIGISGEAFNRGEFWNGHPVLLPAGWVREWHRRTSLAIRPPAPAAARRPGGQHGTDAGRSRLKK